MNQHFRCRFYQTAPVTAESRLAGEHRVSSPTRCPRQEALWLRPRRWGSIIHPMETTAIAETISRALEPYRSGIVCAYLFGSQARGEAKPGSDVDLAVLYRDEPQPSLDGLGFDLVAAVEEATGRPVDIVVLNRASPDLVHRILRDGVLVLETDRSARVRFEVKSRAEYFDVLPYLQEYRRPRHDRP